MPYVKGENDVRLYVKDYDGGGRPVILLHGWPLTADSWEPIAVEIAEAGHRVIAYDRRGFGRSEQPFTGYDYDTMARDLKAVIGETGVKDAALIGFSMAGGEVVNYMADHGGKHVKQVGLISSIAPYMLKTDDHDGVPKDVFTDIKNGLRKDRPGFLHDFFKDFYGQDTDGGGVSDATLEWTLAMAMQASLKATLDCVDAFGLTDLRDKMDAWDQDTLIIHGTNDQIVPIASAGRDAADRVRNGQLIEYDGAPHGIPGTHTKRLAGDLINFINH